jgi:hypothetical protein
MWVLGHGAVESRKEASGWSRQCCLFVSCGKTRNDQKSAIVLFFSVQSNSDDIEDAVRSSLQTGSLNPLSNSSYPYLLQPQYLYFCPHEFAYSRYLFQVDLYNIFLSFGDWFISLSLVFSRSVYFAAGVRTSLLFYSCIFYHMDISLDAYF